MVVGGIHNPSEVISDYYFGLSKTNASPPNITFNVTGGSGADVAGGDFNIAGGKGTGTGVGGKVIIQTAEAAGGTGSSLNALANRIVVLEDGKVGIAIDAPATLLHIDQSVSDAALPVATLDQADIDEPFIKFIGTVTDGAVTGSLVEAADATETLAGFVKIEVQDDGDVLADQDYYMPIYTLA